ncbi:MAG: hypothetical protein KC422_20365 [Trueperaceae bacterium]|nr:hypothetical protein [Trueperaceae bacterium]
MKLEQVGLILLVLALGFLWGRWSAPERASVFRVQQGPDDPRELLPVPGTGQGQQPGQGLVPQNGECPLYFYQDGQFFQMMPGQGFPGQNGSPELIPLQPVPGFPGGPMPIDPGSGPAAGLKEELAETVIKIRN